MPITYGPGLQDWLAAKASIAPPSKETLDQLSGRSTNLDEGFRAGAPATHQYSQKQWNPSTGSVSSQTTATAESRSVYEYKWGYTHPAWSLHKLLRGMDVGGPFLKYDIHITEEGQEVQASFNVTPTVQQVYSGYLYAALEAASIASRKPSTVSSDLTWIRGLTPLVLSSGSMNSLGADAVARCKPTTPAADLSQALGELYRDGLPSLPGKAEGNIGEEYLNYQFAWSPTINDGRDFINAIRNFDSITNQFIRDSGRLIRRRYQFPDQETTSVTTTANSSAAPLTGGLAPNGQQVQLGTLTKTVRTVTQMWFSGAFTYYLPANVLLRRIEILDHAYGVVPGPDTAWALTPWSWLFDWFSNAREVTKNLNDFTLNGLVMPWGYLMRDSTTWTNYKLVTQVRSGTTWTPLVLSNSVVTRSRQRARANPFGFGLSWEGLNPFQISILAALGIVFLA